MIHQKWKRCVDGSDYVMNEKESISFDIYMKAPGEDKSGKTDPIAYNNIYVESGTLNKDTEISFVNTKDVGVPTAAMTNTGAIAGVVMAGVIGIMAIVILKRKKRSEK